MSRARTERAPIELRRRVLFAAEDTSLSGPGGGGA